MAQNMDLQGRHLKIGHEGSALLDDHGGRKGRANSTPTRQHPAASRQGSKPSCIYQYQPHKPLVYQVNPASVTEEVMNSIDVMMKHDAGLLALDYSKKKSTAMAY